MYIHHHNYYIIINSKKKKKIFFLLWFNSVKYSLLKKDVGVFVLKLSIWTLSRDTEPGFSLYIKLLKIYSYINKY